MAKCPVCGKILKNPDHPRHIKSEFHQSKLREKQGGAKKAVKQRETQEREVETDSGKNNEKKEIVLSEPSQREHFLEDLVDEEGYLQIGTLESIQTDEDETDLKALKYLKSGKAKLYFSDLDELLLAMNVLSDFLILNELFPIIRSQNRKKIRKVLTEEIFELDPEYFNTSLYGFELCVWLISNYLGDSSLIEFLLTLEDLEDIISHSYYEESESAENPTLIKIEKTLSRALKGSSQEDYDNAVSVINNSGVFFEHLRKEILNSFRVNEYITLKLVGNRTNIYVKGQLFNQCKYLLLNISKSNIPKLGDIESIDDAAERLDRSMEGHEGTFTKIPPETEFWGHCSNIQAWVESNYDTRLLHRNLAFPLLKRLTQVGDKVAKEVFREEILKRMKGGFPTVIQYLLNEGYLKFLKGKDLDLILDEILEGDLSYWGNKSLKEVLRKFVSLGSTKAQKMLADLIKNENIKGDILKIYDMLSRNELKALTKKDIEEIFNKIESKIINYRETEVKLKVLVKFIEYNIPKAKVDYKKILTEEGIPQNSKTILRYFDSGYLDYVNKSQIIQLLDFSILEAETLNFEKVKLFERFYEKGIINDQSQFLNLCSDAFFSNNNLLVENLIHRGYLKYFAPNELEGIFDNIAEKHFFKSNISRFFSILLKFKNRDLEKAQTLLKGEIKQIIKSGEVHQIKMLFRQRFLSYLEEEEILECIKEINLEQLFKTNITEAIRIIKKFGKMGLTNYEDIIHTQLETLLKNPTEQTISSLLNKSVIGNFSEEEIRNIISEKGTKTIEILLQFILKKNLKSHVRRKIVKFLKKFKVYSEGRVSEKILNLLKDANLEEFCNFVKAKLLEVLSESEKQELLKEPDCLLNQFIVFHKENEFHVDYKLNLDLSNQNITNLKEVKGLENLLLLKNLDLRDNGLKRLSSLGNLKTLKKIRLRGNPFPKSYIDKLGGLDRYGNAKDPQKIIGYCKKLDSGDIEIVKIEGNEVEILDKHLNLEDQNIEKLECIEGLFELSNLESLNLSRNKLETITGIGKLTTLKVLNLSHNSLKDLKGIEKLQSLQKLNLGYNNLSKISGIEHLPSLVELKLYGTGIFELHDKKLRKQLKFIGLDSNREISDEKYLNYLLQSSNVKEIKKICRSYGVKGYSRYRRSELITYTIQCLSEEEQKDFISEFSLPILEKNIKIAFKILNNNHPEKLEKIEVVNPSFNEIEILFKGHNWQNKSFLSITKDSLKDPMRDCDCRIGANMGFCCHFWVGFIFALKNGTFTLSEWNLTPLPLNFKEKVKKFQVINLPTGKKSLASKDSNLPLLMPFLGKKMFIHEATLANFERRQYEWNRKRITYYLSKVNEVKLSFSDKRKEIHTIDSLLVRFSENIYKKYNLKSAKKVQFSGKIEKDPYLGVMLKNVYIDKILEDAKNKDISQVEKEENKKARKNEFPINLREIVDDLNSNWWYHINTETFQFPASPFLREDYPVCSGDILIHKEIKPGDRYPTTRYHLIEGKHAKKVENYTVKKVIIEKLVAYVKREDFMPSDFKVKHMYKNGDYKIVYEPQKNVKFSLKVSPGNFGIIAPESFFKESRTHLAPEASERTNVWFIDSHSDPHKKYKVILKPNGEWSCTCPHHVYRHAICKHIKEVRRKYS